MKKLQILTALVLLGCSTTPLVDGRKFSDPENIYSINIPKKFNKWTTFSKSLDDVGSPYFASEDKENILIKIKNTCGLLGVKNEQRILASEGEITWGHVDFWDRQIYDGMDIQNEYPFCRPPSEPGAAYAFCAEKDGKAVAICIQQMTDDEALAKQIFESFRWTD